MTTPPLDKTDATCLEVIARRLDDVGSGGYGDDCRSIARRIREAIGENSGEAPERIVVHIREGFDMGHEDMSAHVGAAYEYAVPHIPNSVDYVHADTVVEVVDEWNESLRTGGLFDTGPAMEALRVLVGPLARPRDAGKGSS